MRLIDLDTLKRNLCGDCAMNFPKECRQIGCTEVDKQDILEALRIPIIDAVPVRHGKWIDRNGAIVAPFWERYECSECGARSDNSKYCPNCGARMVKE